MTISKKGYQFLNTLSDFWLIFYPDAQVLETILKVEGELVKSLYFSFLQEQLPKAVQNSAIFDEQFWNIISFTNDPEVFDVVIRNDVSYFRYPLDEPYAHIPQLYNIIFNPTVRLKENVDYIIERELVTNTVAESSTRISAFILFKEDPFLNNLIPKRIIGDKYSMALFAPKVFLDYQDLFNKYGTLIDVEDVSSEEYKAFLHGVFYLFTNGPSMSAMNAGLNLAAGYPVARKTENIVSVRKKAGTFFLLSNLDSVYEIPFKEVEEFDELTQLPTVTVFPRLRVGKKPYLDTLDDAQDPEKGENPAPIFVGGVLTPPAGEIKFSADFSDVNLPDGVYPTYFEVDTFDSFLDDLKIVDYQTQPFWWKEQVQKISASLVPDLPENVRENPDVRDFLFDQFFKYNTFGVFIDYRAFRADFLKIPDFIEIMKEVKPTYKSFLVYDRDMKVFTLVRYNPSPLSGTHEPGEDVETPGVGPNGENVFDSIALRSFLDLEDIIAVEKYIAMNLFGSQQPIQIGINLESIKHSMDIISFNITLTNIQTVHSLQPSFEPVVGMGTAWDSNEGLYTRIGMAPREGLLERVRLAIALMVDDTVLAPTDDDPVITPIIEPLDPPFINPVFNVDGDSFEISWTGPVGVTDFRVDVTKFTDNFAVMVTIYDDLAVTGNSLVINNGIEADTAYRVRMRSEDIAGVSANSNIRDVTTDPIVAYHYAYMEGTGNVLGDSGGQNNGAFIEVTPETTVYHLNYREGTGTILNDETGQNDSNIEVI